METMIRRDSITGVYETVIIEDAEIIPEEKPEPEPVHEPEIKKVAFVRPVPVLKRKP